MDIINVISTLGFPIAACLGMAWFFKYTTDTAREDRRESEKAHETAFKSVSQAIANNTIALTKLTERLSYLVPKEDSEDDYK